MQFSNQLLNLKHLFARLNEWSLRCLEFETLVGLMSWSTCRYCGQPVVWSQMPDGTRLPFDSDGGSKHECSVFFKNPVIGSRDHLDREWSFDDCCRRSKCRRCKAWVYWIRHNGGTVILDDLGWPWPKHECFRFSIDPVWFGYFRNQNADLQASGLLGVVVKARFFDTDDRGPPRVNLAVDCGTERRCVAVEGIHFPQHFEGRMVTISEDKQKLLTSNREMFHILNVVVLPEELRFPKTWLTAMPPSSDR
ncbi:MAG: hypothetical protein C0483_26470 [Pirellula sp.]|nr:hypothetical protein [Pirellula sp.]